MKNTVWNVATVVAYLGVLGLAYRQFTRAFARFGGSSAAQQIASGHVSHWATDERTGQSQ